MVTRIRVCMRAQGRPQERDIDECTDMSRKRATTDMGTSVSL